MGTAFSTNRLDAFADISEAEAGVLRRLAGAPATVAAGEILRSEGAANHGVFLLLDGWVVSSVTFDDGARQILKIHLPGDLLGAPSLPYAHAVETLTALTAVRYSAVPLAALGALFAEAPRLGALMFLAAQEERVILMDRLAAIGRLGAQRAVAALFVHLHDRLVLGGRKGAAALDMPLTQRQIGDMLGLTQVHVNRMLRRLERMGALRRAGRRYELVDVEELRALAALPKREVRRNPGWLPG